MRDLFLGFLIFPILLVQKMGYQNIKEYTLKNGMKVLILEDNSSPIISLGIWYKVGSRNEITGKTGISHLLEHMMFKGTKRIGSQEFSKIIQRIGGVDNAFTSNDATCYWEVFPKGSLEKILELESDRMQNLVFREFEEEKKVVMEERRLRTENSPEGIFWEELYALSYKVHPYKNPVIGWMSDLENINLSDVKEHYKTYYSPNNAVMIIVGDVEEKKAISLVKKYFEKVPPVKNIPEMRIKEPKQMGERRMYIKKEGFSKKLGISFRIPEAGSTDEIPLQILAYILGGDKTSRLYRKIVHEKGLATECFAYSDIRIDPGLFIIVADLKLTSSFEEVLSEILAEIEKIKNEDIEEKELVKAKNQIKASFVYSQQSVLRQNFIIGSFENLRGWKKILTYLDEVDKVSKEDIKRVANFYFTENSRNILYLEPILPEKLGEGK